MQKIGYHICKQNAKPIETVIYLFLKNYIRAVKIQRWWRKQMIPCINGDRLSYKISINTLIKNWTRFTNRKIQFISYMVGSRDKTMPIIYTVTCDKTLTKNCLNIRFQVVLIYIVLL